MISTILMNDLNEGDICHGFSKLGKTEWEMGEILQITFSKNVMLKTQPLSGFLCSHAVYL